MALSLVGTGANVFGTTSATATVPGGYTDTAGDLVIVTAVSKRPSGATAGTSVPAMVDWVRKDFRDGGTGAAGADTGPLRFTQFWTISDGSLTIPATTLATHTGIVLGVQCTIYRSDTGTYDLMSGSISDTSSGTSFGGSIDATVTFDADDEVLIVSGLTTDAQTFDSFSISATDATFSSLTEATDSGTTNGDDMRLGVHTGNVTAGPSSAGATTSYTLSGSTTGGQFVTRIREGADRTAGGITPVFRSTSSDDDTASGLTPSKPSGLAEGDLMLGFQVGDADGDLVGMTAPDDTWQSHYCIQGHVTDNYPFLTLWWKIADSGDVAASTFAFGSSANSEDSIVLVAFEAGTFNPSNPLGMPTWIITARTSDDEVTFPAIDNVDDGLRVAWAAIDTNQVAQTFDTPPTSMTERWDHNTGNEWVLNSGFTEALATGSGQASAKTASPNAGATTNGWVGTSLVINPATAVNASAENAAGTGTAYNASVTGASNASAGNAAGTGTANDATADPTMAMRQTVIDAFTDGTIDTGLWTDWGAPNSDEISGVIRFSVTDGVYAGLNTNATVELDGTFYGSQITDAGAQFASLEVYPAAVDFDADNAAGWVIVDSVAYGYREVATVRTYPAEAPYSANNYYAVGILNGYAYWVWSTDATTWHVAHAEPNAFGGTSGTFNLLAGVWNTGTDTVDLDNYSSFSLFTDADAEHAAGTGTAYNAAPGVGPHAEHAAGTGAAQDATTQIDSNPPAEHAAGTGTAYDATVTGASNVSAENAAGTGQAYDASVTGASNVPAEVATGTGTAFNASTNVSAGAESASGTGTAHDATTGVGPGAGHASGYGDAYAAQVLTESNASAENAAGTGTAYNAAAGVGPTAGHASGTGTAYDATSTVDGTTELASGTGTAYAPTPNVGPAAELASGTGSAQDVTAALAPAAELAAGTGSAFDASVTASSNASAGHASGTGSAFDASPSLAPAAELASGTGTAYDGSTNVATGAGHAAGTGAAYDVRMAARFTAPLSTGAPTDNATRYAAGEPDDNVTRYAAGTPTDNVTRYAAGAPA